MMHHNMDDDSAKRMVNERQKKNNLTKIVEFIEFIQLSIDLFVGLLTPHIGSVFSTQQISLLQMNCDTN